MSFSDELNDALFVGEERLLDDEEALFDAADDDLNFSDEEADALTGGHGPRASNYTDLTNWLHEARHRTGAGDYTDSTDWYI